MAQETQKLLLDIDEDGRWETASNFDYGKLQTQVLDLINELGRTFNLNFILDDQVQDASFFADIKIPHELVINPRTDIGYSIRISNYGNLSTINFHEEYSESTTNTFIDTLERSGFVYVNADELDVDYNGTFEKFQNSQSGAKPSWYIRFFDYL